MDGVVKLTDGRAAEHASSRGVGSIRIALTTLAVALVFVAWLGHRRDFAVDHWYALSTVEGVTTYTDYLSETACRAIEGRANDVCVSGTELKP